VTQTATFGRTGVAQFQTSGERGTYTLTVTGITKYLHVFDAAGSSMLSKRVTKERSPLGARMGLFRGGAAFVPWERRLCAGDPGVRPAHAVLQASWMSLHIWS
jgi:hypothetical protein